MLKERITRKVITGPARVIIACMLLVEILSHSAAGAVQTETVPYALEPIGEHCYQTTNWSTAPKEQCRAEVGVILPSTPNPDGKISLNLAVDSGLNGRVPNEPVVAYGTATFIGEHPVQAGTGQLTYSAKFRLNNSTATRKATTGNAVVRSLLSMSIQKSGTEQWWSDVVWDPHKAPSSTPFQLSVKIPATSKTTVFRIFLHSIGMAQLTPPGPIESYPYPKPYYEYGAWDVCAPGYYPDGTPCVPSPLPYRAGTYWSGTNPTAAGKASLLLNTTAPHLTVARP